MRNFILTALLVLAFNFGYAQQKELDSIDLKSGKYFPNENEIYFSGNWISEDGSYAIKISTNSKAIHNKDLDFKTDIAIISFTKFLQDDNNLTSKIQPMEVMSSSDGLEFTGYITDPVTNNTAKLTLRKISNTKIRLFVRLSPISISGDRKNGTIFPNEIEFSKQKGND